MWLLSHGIEDDELAEIEQHAARAFAVALPAPRSGLRPARTGAPTAQGH
jgi:hypothetical protein